MAALKAKNRSVVSQTPAKNPSSKLVRQESAKTGYSHQQSIKSVKSLSPRKLQKKQQKMENEKSAQIVIENIGEQLKNQVHAKMDVHNLKRRTFRPKESTRKLTVLDSSVESNTRKIYKECLK